MTLTKKQLEMFGQIDKKKLYKFGMKALKKHNEQTMHLVMKSRNENKGNFKYIETKDYKRESKIAHYLTLFLWKLHLELTNNTKKEGCCGVPCYNCTYPRYNTHSKKGLAKDHWCNDSEEGWCCQYECECK